MSAISTLAPIATTPPIELEGRPSLGELAVVPSKLSTETAYERTLALIESTRREIASVTTVKGRTATPSAKDTWLERNDWTQGTALLAAAASAITALCHALAADGSATIAAGAAAALVGSVAFVYHAAHTRERLKTKAERHAGEVFDRADLDRMTATLRAATPEERAMVEGFVTKALASIDRSLSAQAAIQRERLMKDLPVLDASTKRAAELAAIVDELRNGAWLCGRIGAIRGLLAAAPPDEREILAHKLDTGAFDDSKPFVAAERENVRELVTLIEAARRGEAVPSEQA